MLCCYDVMMLWCCVMMLWCIIMTILNENDHLQARANSIQRVEESRVRPISNHYHLSKNPYHLSKNHYNLSKNHYHLSKNHYHLNLKIFMKKTDQHRGEEDRVGASPRLLRINRSNSVRWYYSSCKKGFEEDEKPSLLCGMDVHLIEASCSTMSSVSASASAW